MTTLSLYSHIIRFTHDAPELIAESIMKI